MNVASARTLLAPCWAIFAVGCGTERDSPTVDASVSNTSPTLARDIQPILDRYCVSCHAFGAAEPNGNPHFTADSSARSFTESSDCTSGGSPVRLVVPGKPEESFVLYKLGAETTLTVSRHVVSGELRRLRVLPLPPIEVFVARHHGTIGRRSAELLIESVKHQLEAAKHLPEPRSAARNEQPPRHFRTTRRSSP